MAHPLLRRWTAGLAAVAVAGTIVVLGGAPEAIAAAVPSPPDVLPSWSGVGGSTSPGRAAASVFGAPGDSATVRFFASAGPTCSQATSGPGVVELPSDTVRIGPGGEARAQTSGSLDPSQFVYATSRIGGSTSAVSECEQVLVGPAASPHVTGATRTSLTFAWGAAPGASGYEIVIFKRGSAVAASTQVDAGVTQATVGGLAPGGVYRATIEAQSSDDRGLGPIDVEPRPDPPHDAGYLIPPFGTIKQAADRQYRDFIGGAVTAAQLASWNEMADDRTTTSSMISTLVDARSWGGQRAPVIRPYDSFFQRRPDANGLAYWTGRRKVGATVAQIAQTFAASPEFERTYGALTNGQFVDLVYRNVLRRSPDPSGRSYWIRRLDQRRTSRGGLMASFSESTEHVAAARPTVDAVLVTTGMLRRMPTDAEYATWAPPTDAPPRIELIFSILSSAEYEARIHPA
jgi:hypothetical protein